MTLSATGDTLLNASVEIEFLVAIEKEDQIYNTDNPSSDAENIDSNHKWACPSQTDDPSSEALYQCKAVLSKADKSVIIRHNEAHLTERSWQSARFNSWVLQPSQTAHASASSPKDYDWCGVRLRSPLISEDELCNTSPMDKCLETIRNSTRIHINLTCKFKIALHRDTFTLVQAKKLATLVWLTEQDLLVPLRNQDCDSIVHPQAVTTSSITATCRLRHADTSISLDPLLEGIMNSHLPSEMRDTVSRGCLRRLWACPNLRRLSGALRDRHQNALAFALYIYDDDDAEDSNASSCAVASFRCALHPQEATSRLWTELVLAFGRAASLAPEPFKQLVGEIDRLNCSYRMDESVDESSHRKQVMQALGMDEELCKEWDKIIECRNNGEEVM